mmetsp:Transcript_12857/g.47004  ORF Transcript_12857/g.47004 Transcript_12857/m.47004 type:complete len:394 (-) Transcript_12857:25-1206(-)
MADRFVTALFAMAQLLNFLVPLARASHVCKQTNNEYEVTLPAQDWRSYEEVRCYSPASERGAGYSTSDFCFLSAAFAPESLGQKLRPCSNDYFAEYRISDRVLTTMEICLQPQCRAVIDKVFPDSILARFLESASRVELTARGSDKLEERMPLLMAALVGYARDHGMLRNQSHAHAPGRGVALVHTRLGDVLEFNKNNATEIFKHATCFTDRKVERFVTMPKGFHIQVAKKLQERKVRKVELVGSLDHVVDKTGNQMSSDEYAGNVLTLLRSKSLKYVRILKSFYETKGFEVKIRLSKQLDSDEDLVYFMQADLFASAILGFARLAQNIVSSFGGTVIYPDNGYDNFRIRHMCKSLRLLKQRRNNATAAEHDGAQPVQQDAAQEDDQVYDEAV